MAKTVKAEMKEIPEQDVSIIVAGFRHGKCDKISAERQANGLWTVKAECPDPVGE